MVSAEGTCGITAAEASLGETQQELRPQPQTEAGLLGPGDTQGAETLVCAALLSGKVGLWPRRLAVPAWVQPKGTEQGPATREGTGTLSPGLAPALCLGGRTDTLSWKRPYSVGPGDSLGTCHSSGERFTCS